MKEIKQYLDRLYERSMIELKDPSEPASEKYYQWLKNRRPRRIETLKKVSCFFLGCFLTAFVLNFEYVVGFAGSVRGWPLLAFGVVCGLISFAAFLIALRLEASRKKIVLDQNKEFIAKMRSRVEE